MTEQLAACLAEHRPYGLDCKCGRPINSDQDWAAHLSEAITLLEGVTVVDTTVCDCKGTRCTLTASDARHGTNNGYTNCRCRCAPCRQAHADAKASGETCSIDGCDRPAVARGWCHRCYYRWTRTGDPELVRTRPLGTTPDGALQFTGWEVTDSGCWEWKGSRDHAGYGKLKYQGQKYMAHRFAYQTWVGQIPDGLLVRHRICDNPPCINPAHLELGTQVDNMRDMKERGRQKITFGEQSPHSKLTTADVLKIREIRAKEGLSHKKLADLFEVSETLVRQVLNGKSWKHVL